MGNSKQRSPKYLIFRSSGLDCGFPLDAVREIVPMATLSRPPGLPSGLAGFLDLRGTAIPILRLDRMFDLSEQLSRLYTPMILLHGVRSPIGILADSVRGIVPVQTSQLVDLAEDCTFLGCAAAVLELDGDRVYLLSPAALLRSNEDRLLSDYAALSQARLLQLEETDCTV